MYLVDKMANSPKMVWDFLESLATKNRIKADLEVQKMAGVKKTHVGNSEIYGWDRHYYGQFVTPPSQLPHQTMVRSTDLNISISEYFTVGSVFQRLSDVFGALYGVRLEPEESFAGELWHEDVQKLAVVHEQEGRIGTIYCDLFQRQDVNSRKYENPAHFTIRCSRRVDDDEPLMSDDMFKSVQPERIHDDKRYQVPIVVMVTNLTRPRPGHPCLLNLNDIDTIFHEMGHAMHSMLAQTDFQHIAGTRVAMDFVEVPSIFMEYFSKSHQVLGACEHYQTGQRIPLEVLQDRRELLGHFEGLDTQHQIQMSMLDQLYHSDAVSHSQFNSTKVLYELQNRISPIPAVQGTAWQGQFSHLFSYGCSYYSYLWSRRWASRIFYKHFDNKPMENWREGGQIFRDEILKWGGGRDPWKGLEEMGIVRDSDFLESKNKDFM